MVNTNASLIMATTRMNAMLSYAWENDWPDCPLGVVELKSEIMRLPSR